jgi:glycosyltransferase involved in cell wall biosynthesis
MEKVSIVIPTYNEIKYLPTCFDNCYFQSYPEIEIIIVDGGSTDGTKEFLSQLNNELQSRESNPVIGMDERGKIVYKRCFSYHEDTHATHPKREIKILTYEENIGRTLTYNAGFKVASGKYCTYIVGDDIAHPHMIEELVSALEKYKVDVVYSDFNIVDDDGLILRLVRKPEYDFEECFARWFHLGVARLYRAELHRKIGLMDESYQVANDYKFFLEAAKAGATFKHIGKILYSVRFHGAETQLDESLKLAAEARTFLNSFSNG